MGQMRLIDKVIIKGSKEPLELFSVDLDYMALKVDEPYGAPLTWTSHQRYRSRQLLEADKRRIWQDHVCIADLFYDCPDIEVMRRKYTEEFRHLFNMGYQNYSQGEWQVARQLLSRTLTMPGGAKDGPSVALLRFMEIPHQF